MSQNGKGLGMTDSVLILGGGFGGLTVSNELLREMGSRIQITVVDKSEVFAMGLSKLWVLAGYREADAERNRSLLKRKGINFIQDEITQIDIENKTIRTRKGNLSYDYLVVALGAEPMPSLVPGFSEIGFNIYAREDVRRLRDTIRLFERGRLVMFIGIPYKCPPAPYEAIIIMDDILRKRKVRESVSMELHTPQPIALPIAGKEPSHKIASALSERGIELVLSSEAENVDASNKTISFKNGERRSFDLLVGVPPHRPPKVVMESALRGETPWIPVDRHTLQTRFANVYAVGDVTGIKLPGGMMFPKAGIFAELEGLVVAKNIAAKLGGTESLAKYDGAGYCFAELSPGKAAYMRGEFFAEPYPSVVLDEPSDETFEKKVQFEKERLEKWF